MHAAQPRTEASAISVVIMDGKALLDCIVYSDGPEHWFFNTTF